MKLSAAWWRCDRCGNEESSSAINWETAREVAYSEGWVARREGAGPELHICPDCSEAGEKVES